jgi:hypothetical protein
MKVSLEGQEIKNCQFTYEGVNMLGFDSIDEIYFDVFEIKTNQYQIIKEKKEEKNGLPVVELDVTVGNTIFKNVKFQLTKENVVKINQNTLNRRNSTIIEHKIPLIDKNKDQRLIKEQLLTNKPVENSVKTELKKLIQKESKTGLIKKLIKENTEELFRELLLNDSSDKQVQKFFEGYTRNFKKSFIEIAEKIARRESLRFAESGGGTNAVQYANGGTMDGDLIVTQTIVAASITDTQGRQLVSKLTFDIIGNNSTRTFTLNHNLNTKNILINVYDINNDELVFVSSKNTDLNNTTIQFPNNLLNGENYRVIMFA